MKGRIHSFETLGATDGPGIRFVIFMQGCHLKCKYCQNRDTWNTKVGIEYEVDDVVEKVLRYKNYIKNNGGVTVSGGEPLLQQDFLIELFKKLKKYGINTCIDTSGQVAITDKLKELISLTDLFLVDIKCINDDICKELTGVSNKLELEFIRYLSDNGKKMWIRQVLVPTITDNEEDLKELSKFIKSLKTVEKVEVLKYHNLGKFKWENLKLKYPLEGLRLANQEDYNRVVNILDISDII